MNKIKTLIFSLSTFCSLASAHAEVITYPAPSEAKLNNSFSVEVRQNDSWLPVAVYNVMVDEVIGTKHTVKNSSMAYFDFSGEVEVRVIAHNKTVDTARIRPLSYDVAHNLNGDTISFSLDRPRNLSIEVNGDIFDNLQLWANGLDANQPSAKLLKKLSKDKNYIYFGAGYHKLDTLKVKSNQHLHISGGAVVDGVIEVDDAENVKITGHGMIYPYRKMGLRVSRSKNVEIDGLFTTQCAVGESDNVRVSNVKLISYYGWGDGFNVFASSNVSYDGVFARTSDDCTTIYCTRLGYNGSSCNIVMENSTLWADVAHPIEIGIHGNVDAPDSIVGAVYRNIDILDMKEKQIDYQGAFAITCGDNNLVKNIRFEDIRVENFREGKLVDFRICYNKKYCKAPGRGIEDIYLKNITYNGDNAELSMIIGYDETRMVKGVHFENLVINGTRIFDSMPGKPGWYKTADMARIFIGEHVENVTFE